MRLYAVLILTALMAVDGCASWSSDHKLQRGKGLYEEYCMACHGPGGKGDGYRVLNPPPADLTSPLVQKKLDADLLKTIHDGRPNTTMGSWRFVLSGAEAREVVAYIRSLSR